MFDKVRPRVILIRERGTGDVLELVYHANEADVWMDEAQAVIAELERKSFETVWLYGDQDGQVDHYREQMLRLRKENEIASAHALELYAHYEATISRLQEENGVLKDKLKTRRRKARAV